MNLPDPNNQSYFGLVSVSNRVFAITFYWPAKIHNCNIYYQKEHMWHIYGKIWIYPRKISIRNYYISSYMYTVSVGGGRHRDGSHVLLMMFWGLMQRKGKIPGIRISGDMNTKMESFYVYGSLICRWISYENRKEAMHKNLIFCTDEHNKQTSHAIRHYTPCASCAHSCAWHYVGSHVRICCHAINSILASK